MSARGVSVSVFALLVASSAAYADDSATPSAREELEEPSSEPAPDRFYYAGQPSDAPVSEPSNWRPPVYETVHLDVTLRQPLPDDVREWVRTEYWPSVAHRLIGYGPSDPVADELESVMRDAGPDEIGLYSRALRALWQVAPDRVPTLVEEAPRGPHHLVNDAYARLRAWPEHDEAYDALVGMGFEGERASPEFGEPPGFWNNSGVQWPLRPLTVVDELQAMGAAICFDMEIAELPIAYHELAYTLAALQRDFPDAGFGSSQLGGTDANYELAAWWGESVWTVEIEDNGDWIHLRELLGLMNTVARHAANPARFAMLPATGQSICIVGGAETAINALEALEMVQIDYRY